MSSFSEETIENIIRNIDENDFNSLYSISLTNKTWCKLTIPYLWKKPFNVVKNWINNRHPKIIRILLYSLDYETKLLLKINELHNNDMPIRTFFDYPSFIKQLNFSILHSLIHSWVCENREIRSKIIKPEYYTKNPKPLSFNYNTLTPEIINNNSNSSHNNNNNNNNNNNSKRKCSDIETLVFFECIYKMILRKTEGIEVLRIVMRNEKVPKIFFVNLYQLKENQHKFSSLKRLTCKGECYKVELLNLIGKNANQIVKISLDNHENDLESQHIESFFLSQKNLKELSIKPGKGNNDNEIFFKILNGTISDNLQSIKFSQTISNIELKYLVNCKNLKRIYFKDVTLSKSNMLENILFSYLEELKIENCTFKEEEIREQMKKFIINNTKNLKNVRLINIGNGKGLFEFLDIVSENCFNINNLCVKINEGRRGKNDLESIMNILKNCKKLKVLDFGEEISNDSYTFDQNMEKITKCCCESSSSLRKFYAGNFIISLYKFKYFFNRCSAFLNEIEIESDASFKKLKKLVEEFSELNNRDIVSLHIQDEDRGSIRRLKVVLQDKNDNVIRDENDFFEKADEIDSDDSDDSEDYEGGNVDDGDDDDESDDDDL